MGSRHRTAGTGPAVLADGTGEAAVAFQLGIQDGVITRTQLTALGMSPADIARKVRRRELVRVAPGVFIDHTGAPTWIQRAWVAVLRCWPAALAMDSVWEETAPIHLAVAAGRKLRRPPGVSLHRMRHLDRRVNWMLGPPRIVLEDAVLDVAAVARDDHAAVAALTARIRARQTSAAALSAALAGRPRLPRGAWLRAVLADLESGVDSVLELEYLRRVERPHGLPRAQRQVRESTGGRRVVRDALYEVFGVVVELDGREHHEGPRARDRDLERDLSTAARSDRVTLRLGWGQVVGRPCRTAAQVGVILTRRGWAGTFRRCPRCSSEAP